MKNLTNLNDVDLLKKEKSAKTVIYVIAVLLIISIVAGVSGYLENGFTASSVLPILILGLLLSNFTTIKSIKKEKKLRDLHRKTS